MTLARLQIEQFRNVRNASLALHPEINLIHGLNGSGKSSLLEAVYVLSCGRSFRTAKLGSVVMRDADRCVIFGEVASGGGSVSRLGFARWQDGRREVKLNSVPVRRFSELAYLLPSVSIGPESVDLLVGGPGQRRQFINRGVFHVEPGFASIWRELEHVLRQRNALLRGGASAHQVAVWTSPFIERCERVSEWCETYIEDVRSHFFEIWGEMDGPKGMEIRYYRGWDAKRDLAAILEERLVSDQQRGFTQAGSHRADLRVQRNKGSATDNLSRGELKLAAWALLVAQARTQGDRCLLLVDDLPSELDRVRRRSIWNSLVESRCQIVATGVEPRDLDFAGDRGNVFHVKQGEVSPDQMRGHNG
jgi:DNA replication and repair protein RecF